MCITSRKSLAAVSCTWLLVFLQADYERRLLQLCYEGTADISQFRELLRQGVDVYIYDEVGIIILLVRKDKAHHVHCMALRGWVLIPLPLTPRDLWHTFVSCLQVISWKAT